MPENSKLAREIAAAIFPESEMAMRVSAESIIRHELAKADKARDERDAKIRELISLARGQIMLAEAYCRARHPHRGADCIRCGKR